ncbi:uncharacterized protein LOC123514253 [Portunus trituberculatus]|uniref:uncharacterized protein LOC123514253 n=1 Tax=Portunus trituberculatus TaxID=210409 RepID=UPI001E1CF453|nr:uncharacterized protein LOC123514253 [Portunus trituberculatus]
MPLRALCLCSPRRNTCCGLRGSSHIDHTVFRCTTTWYSMERAWSLTTPSTCCGTGQAQSRYCTRMRVPAGFRVCRLGRAGVRHLLENAKYGGIRLDLMYRMAEGVPYIGVYQDPTSAHEATVDPENLPVAGDEEIPVSWICSAPIGDMGKMKTDKRFRRLGFFTLLSMTLARMQSALIGFIPHAYIDMGNYASQAGIAKLPGWSMTHESIWIKKNHASL